MLGAAFLNRVLRLWLRAVYMVVRVVRRLARVGMVGRFVVDVGRLLSD